VIEILVEACPHALLKGDDSHGWLPIHFAVKEEALEVVQYLIRKCVVALQMMDDDGNLPLHLLAASERASPEMARCVVVGWPQALEENDNDGRLTLESRRIASSCHRRSFDA
jgi:Ankyrin repeats (3 copies)